MVLSNPVLHQALTSLEIGPREAAFGFTRRLARDNGWPTELAARVVSEYLRFVYLCAVAGRPMTPSDAVDQAWHLHLTYTRSYWDELCGRVLGRPLHHEPTRGGASERERFEGQYDDTLASYEREFDMAPPADIWPARGDRFAARYRRISLRDHWVIRRPAWRPRALALSLAGLPLVLGAAARDTARVGASAGAGEVSFRVGGTILLFFLAVTVLGYLRDRGRQRRARDRGPFGRDTGHGFGQGWSGWGHGGGGHGSGGDGTSGGDGASGCGGGGGCGGGCGSGS